MPLAEKQENIQNILKEIDSLRDFIKNNPLPKEFEKSLDEDFRLNYTYNSNAIEGNTLTLVETKVVLEGITIGGKTLREHFEVINHQEAIYFIEDLVQENEPLSQRLICEIHSLILKNINDREAGKYRSTLVSVGGFIPPQPYLLKPQMEHFINTYHNLKLHPILKASYAHLEFIRIHPFIDGNGRTARLMMNLELLKSNYPAINISFEKRKEYYEAIREYSNFNKGSAKFDKLIATYILQSLRQKKDLIIQNQASLQNTNNLSAKLEQLNQADKDRQKADEAYKNAKEELCKANLNNENLQEKEEQENLETQARKTRKI